MARDDKSGSSERGGRSGGKDRQQREHSPDQDDMRSGGARNDRDDYYGNHPSESDRAPGNNRYEGGGLADESGSPGDSNRSFANRSWHEGDRTPQDNQQRQRGEGGTSGSESGRGFGAPWSTNRERGNSEYDHGPFEDGDTNPRARGQGVYNHRPGQAGQENLGGSGNRGRDDGNWGAQSRGTEGGRARGNSFGDSGGDGYGGGGRHGGSRDGGAGRSGGGPRSDRERDERTERGGRSEAGGGFGGYGGPQGGFQGGQGLPDGVSHAGRGPKGWKRSDERIRDDVSEQLERHHEIDASEIEVAVEQGEVTLSGTVEDRRTKRLAEDIIEGMSGVTEVHNQIRVRRQ